MDEQVGRTNEATGESMKKTIVWVIAIGIFISLTFYAHCQVMQGTGHIEGAWSNTNPMPEHLQHASPKSLWPSICGITVGQGTQPVTDFQKLPFEKPLGDVAREYRNEFRTKAGKRYEQ